MKAILFHNQGDIDALEYGDFPTPEPGPGQVLVRLKAAGRGGRILTVGNTGHPKVEIDNRYIFAKHLSLIGSTMGTHYDFRTVMQLVFSGRLNPILDQTHPLSEAGTAQQRLARGEQMGKITLAID